MEVRIKQVLLDLERERVSALNKTIFKALSIVMDELLVFLSAKICLVSFVLRRTTKLMQ